MMPNLRGRPGETGGSTFATCEPIIGRLVTEFVVLPPNTVERCVVDVWACARHLGLAVTPVQVERVAREHLMGVVKSEPPSGRPL